MNKRMPRLTFWLAIKHQNFSACWAVSPHILESVFATLKGYEFPTGFMNISNHGKENEMQIKWEWIKGKLVHVNWPTNGKAIFYLSLSSQNHLGCWEELGVLQDEKCAWVWDTRFQCLWTLLSLTAAFKIVKYCWFSPSFFFHNTCCCRACCSNILAPTHSTKVTGVEWNS